MGINHTKLSFCLIIFCVKVWYLFLITPRVLALAMFAATFRSWFWIIIFAHWFGMLFWILRFVSFVRII